MDTTRPPAAAPRVGTWVLVNLPAALFFWAVYFIGCSPLWGPLVPWKWALALSVLPALCLGLDVRTWRPRRRRAPPAGGREAEAEAQWPWWRRAGAIYAGTVLGGIGIYQSLGIEVDIHMVPLLSGLCLIVSLAIGLSLVLVAWPRERWRRRPRRTVPRQERATGIFLPGEEDDSRGTSIRVPTPSSSGHAGVWGGFGTKPAAKVWTPGGSSSAASNEPVPERFRRLRIVAKLGGRGPRTPASSSLLAAVVAVIALIAAALVAYGCAVA